MRMTAQGSVLDPVSDGVIPMVPQNYDPIQASKISKTHTLFKTNR